MNNDEQKQLDELAKAYRMPFWRNGVALRYHMLYLLATGARDIQHIRHLLNYVVEVILPDVGIVLALVLALVALVAFVVTLHAALLIAGLALAAAAALALHEQRLF